MIHAAFTQVERQIGRLLLEATAAVFSERPCDHGKQIFNGCTWRCKDCGKVLRG